jgi:KDEL-tailed cysteine endopeptidase
MQKTVVIALAVLGTLTAGYFLFRNKTVKTVDTEATALKDVYNQWKVEFKVNVGAAEDDYRFKVFSSNYGKIKSHNRLLGRSYSLGLNPFSHLTTEEFAATRLGLKMPTTFQRNVAQLPTDNLQATVDWRGKMNAVKNQGMCGSCWAFSAIGALEGLHSVKKSNLMNLSEQELVDCSTSYGNMGCNGGLMDYAFQYIADKKGIATQSDYPYKAVDQSCKTGKARNAPITAFTDVPVNSAAALKAAIAQQPVSVAIEADTFTFQSYTSGVINDASCGTNLDHGVVAVGYNDSDRIPYYLVRNSWGTSWGDKGHVKIGIQDGAGICGIQMAASYPTL